MKELPKIYKNRTVTSNNKSLFYSANDNDKKINVGRCEELNTSLSIANKKDLIKDLLTSTRSGYTKEIEIITKEKTYKTRLVGMNDDYVLTLDNDKIELKEILNIIAK